jgi:hypothetical protein
VIPSRLRASVQRLSSMSSRFLLRGLQVEFLKGGLEGWRPKGFPVEPYTKSFRLNSGSSNHLETAR